MKLCVFKVANWMCVCMQSHIHVAMYIHIYVLFTAYVHVFYFPCSAEEFDDEAPPTFDNPSGTPIHFTSVVCTGLEFNIGQCQWSTETDSCTNTNAVGVRCTNTPGLCRDSLTVYS